MSTVDFLCKITFEDFEFPFTLEVHSKDLLKSIPPSEFPEEIRDKLKRNPKKREKLTKIRQPFEPFLLDSPPSPLTTLSLQKVFRTPDKHSQEDLLKALVFIQNFIQRDHEYPLDWDLEDLENPYATNSKHFDLLLEDWEKITLPVRKILLRGLLVSEETRFHQMIARAEAKVFINNFTSEEYREYLEEMKV